MPTTIVVSDLTDNSVLFIIHRGVSFFRPKVTVKSPQGEMIGYFRAKLFSLGVAFYSSMPTISRLAMSKGIGKAGISNCSVHLEKNSAPSPKKWAGMAKEIFTSADNYIVALSPTIQSNRSLATLLLAAGLAIDTVFKESKN